MRADGGGSETGATGEGAPDGGCAAHGLALLLASLAAVILMLAVTFACWVLYRLVG